MKYISDHHQKRKYEELLVSVKNDIAWAYTNLNNRRLNRVKLSFD